MADQKLSENMQGVISKMADQVMESPGFQDEVPVPDSSVPSPEKETSPANNTSEVKEPAEKPSNTGEGEKEPAPVKEVQEDESSLPQELRTPKEVLSNEDALKRVKGFQSAFTKKMQSLESEIRNEYEKKFQEVLTKMPVAQQQASQQSNQPAVPTGESLAEFFPGVPREQIEPLDKAVKALIEKRISPLKEENAQLKTFINQAQANQAIQTQFIEAKKDFPEIESRMDDLVAWSMANPAVVKGKSVKEMYMLMTYSEQFKKGRETAVSELKKKEKESVETDSVPNTVSTKKPKTFAEAAELAWQATLAKYKK